MRSRPVLAAVLGVLVAACLPVAVLAAVSWGKAGPPPRPWVGTRSGAGAGAARPPRWRAGMVAAASGPDSGYVVTARTILAWSARPGGAPVGSLPADNPYGQPQALAVVGRPAGGWARVELPLRPNGQSGWVRLSSVRLTWTPYAVAVNLEARTVTVTDGATVVMTVPAAVGAPATYTPKGRTFVWESIRLGDPSGPYGPFAFGLAEFSDSYRNFGGGPAQIAIHGTDEPWSIGRPVSAGCVRIADQQVARLALLLPLGTPVTIS